MTKTLLLALAIALIIEGLIPALFPNKWRAYVLRLANESVSSIRTIGIVVLSIGCVLFWLAS